MSSAPERIKTASSEIREDTRNVGAFKEELKKVKTTSENIKENKEATEQTQDLLEDLKKTSLITILEKHRDKGGKEINYREEYAKNKNMITGETGVITTAAQIALKDLGINPGKIDGIYGRRTQSAINLFKEKVSTTDELGIGPKTIQKLIDNIKKKEITITPEELNILEAKGPVGGNTHTIENNSITDKKQSTIIEKDTEQTIEVSKERFDTGIYSQISRNIKKIFLKNEFKGNQNLLKYLEDNNVYTAYENPYFVITNAKNSNINELGRINIRTIIQNGQFQKTEYINKVKEIIENKDKEKKFITAIESKSYTLDSLGFSPAEKNNLSIQAYMEKINNGIFKFSNTKIDKKDQSSLHVELTTNELKKTFWEIKVDNFTKTNGSFDFDEAKFKKWLKTNIKHIANKEHPLT